MYDPRTLSLSLLPSLLLVNFALLTTAHADVPKPGSPGVVTKPTAVRPATQATASTKRVLVYDIVMGSKKAGTMTQTEWIGATGALKTKTTSSSSFRFFFRTYKSSMLAHNTYRNGKIQSFDIDSTQRGKRVLVKGKRTAKGIVVVQTKDGKTTTKTFAFGSFDATSSDLGMPMKSPGTKLTRRLLQLAEQKVINQTLHFQKKIQKTFQGQSVELVQVNAKGPRGAATLLFTSKGRMFEMFLKIPFVGKMQIILRHAKGLTF